MRTTLVIPDAVYRELKRRAAETGKTISGLATEFIRRGLSTEPPSPDLSPLPTFSLGKPLVDVADREALYELFDRDEGWGEQARSSRSRQEPDSEASSPAGEFPAGPSTGEDPPSETGDPCSA